MLMPGHANNCCKFLAFTAPWTSALVKNFWLFATVDSNEKVGFENFPKFNLLESKK